MVLCESPISTEQHPIRTNFISGKAPTEAPSEAEISAIIEMALSDHISFDNIEREFGRSEKEVKALMRANLKSGSYRAWRKRVRDFSDQREHYK